MIIKNSDNLGELREEVTRKDYVKPEVKFVPLKVEERLMSCLKTGEELQCQANIGNS